MLLPWRSWAPLLSVTFALAGCATPTGTGRPPVSGPDTEATRASRPPVEDPAAPEGEPAPPLGEPPGDPFAGVVPQDAELARALQASRAHYQEGRLAFADGDFERAWEAFDRAVEVFSAGPLAARPEARPLREKLREQTEAYRAVWRQASGDLAEQEDEEEYEEEEEGEEGTEPAPMDALAVDLPEVAGPPHAVLEAPVSRLAHDVPLEVNNQVEYMLEVYKGRIKDQVLAAFERSGRYLPLIRDIFREEGVPLDLAWLALVESAFKPNAYSRARAKGLWQFIRSTGRLYGLRVDDWVDERSDPAKATRAAARHLKDLYERYGDWYLSLAAYNAGAGKVDRAVRRLGRSDYWAIAGTRHLRRETKNYVPAFLATLLIASDPASHGFEYTPEAPWTFAEVVVEGPVDLEVAARCAGTSVEELRRLNPELRHAVTPANQPRYRLRVPVGCREAFELAYAELPPGERLRYAVHTVRPGETLGRIARRYGVGVDRIVEVNRIGRRHRLEVGAELRIPLSPGYATPRRSGEEAAADGVGTRYHRVRPGDTLSRIARRYRVSVRDLKRWNALGASDRIYVGARLRLSPSRGQGVASSPSLQRTLTHRVRKGETLWRIADRYGVSVQDLRRWNGGVGHLLRVGERLKVLLPASR